MRRIGSVSLAGAGILQTVRPGSGVEKGDSQRAGGDLGRRGPRTAHKKGMEAIAVGEMIDLEGFDSQFGALFGDLSALARALGAGSDAEDVAQEALLEARSHLHQLRDTEKLRAWVR